MFLVIVLALAAALCNSIFSLVNRWALVCWRVSPLSSSLLIQAAAGLLALAAILLFHIGWRTGADVEMLSVGAMSMGAFMLMMLAFQREDASAVAPLLGLKVIFLAVLEPLVTGGGIGLGVPLGAVVSAAGVMLSSQTDRWSLHPRDIARPGVLLMLAAALGFALCDLLVKRALHVWHGNSLGVALYLVLISGVLAIALLPFFSRRRKTDEAATALTHGVIVPMLISAVCWFLMQYFIFSSFARSGEVTLPNIVYNTRNLMVVMLAAALVLGKKSTVEQAGPRAYTYRAFGAVATIGAIALALLLK